MDRIGVQHIVYQIILVTVVAIVVGTAASLAAIGFVDAVHYLNDRLLISPYARVLAEDRPGLVAAATLIVPAAGGLIVGLVVHFLVREKRGLAPPDAILAAQTSGPAPGFRSGVASSLAALVSLGSGASVGQYGPLVYLGAMFGNLAGRLRLNLRHQRSIAIACGVAAAISTAFNAPIAGLVFAHEVILRHYSLRAFAPVTVAAATGYIIANVIFDRPALFLVSFDRVEHSYEFVFFALEGVLCAGLAWVFMLLLRFSTNISRRHIAVPWVRPAIAGLMVGLVALWIPEVLGIGQETLRFATIEGAFGIGELGLIIVAKLVLTALCVGFGFVGGVFSPALLIGILFGAFYGLMLPYLAPVPHSGLEVYAICGMMALASSVIGAPLTTILIVFELTRSYDLTIAAMVAVVFANLISYRVIGRSLFDLQLRERGFDLSLGRDKAILETHRIRDYLSTNVTTVSERDTVGDVRQRLVDDHRSEAMVLNRDQKLLGVVRLQGIVNSQADTPVLETAIQSFTTFDEDTSVWQSMEMLRGFLGEAVPLVDRRGRLKGVVPEEAVIRAYLEIMHDLREEENEAA
ncbi:chloride channel protein [Marinobacter panjinensis]|uniref:Chloride channel protein n=1 Tax=Marinobacter panjinensis TaxID=2576384 RepID=A0A4U6QTX5_9GAMM|nr:chloride channel protein [Marinobacter panjinensis]MCR8915085.1 chloride channel protein [Marinobacter panjinensis]TKV64320.1 chloride channel protein [Marinobacter panjinensis]